MSTPEPKRDPKAPPKVLIVTKASAARTQLETAIGLWFTDGDPISILALAVAANDCYHADGRFGREAVLRTDLGKIAVQGIAEANP